jgi:hypothetical protein
MSEFVDADRTYIFDYDFTHNTYDWCRDGVVPEIDNLQNVSTDNIPQWVEQHSKSLEMWKPWCHATRMYRALPDLQK